LHPLLSTIVVDQFILVAFDTPVLEERDSPSHNSTSTSMAAVNRPTDVKQKEADVNQKLQLYGIYAGKWEMLPMLFAFIRVALETWPTIILNVYLGAYIRLGANVTLKQPLRMANFHP
jgi:hypothetical protein